MCEKPRRCAGSLENTVHCRIRQPSRKEATQTNIFQERHLKTVMSEHRVNRFQFQVFLSKRLKHKIKLSRQLKQDDEKNIIYYIPEIQHTPIFLNNLSAIKPCSCRLKSCFSTNGSRSREVKRRSLRPAR